MSPNGAHSFLLTILRDAHAGVQGMDAVPWVLGKWASVARTRLADSRLAASNPRVLIGWKRHAVNCQGAVPVLGLRMRGLYSVRVTTPNLSLGLDRLPSIGYSCSVCFRAGYWRECRPLQGLSLPWGQQVHAGRNGQSFRRLSL